LGFEFHYIRSLQGKWRPYYPPKLKDIFRRFDSQPVGRVVQLINPILRGWVNYFAIGNASRYFGFVRDLGGGVYNVGRRIFDQNPPVSRRFLDEPHVRR
jgi:hypothetical protein